MEVTWSACARLFSSGNLVYGCKMGTGIRLTAPTKGTTAFVSFFSTIAAATNGKQHEKVCKELANVGLFPKALFKPFCQWNIDIYNSFFWILVERSLKFSCWYASHCTIAQLSLNTLMVHLFCRLFSTVRFKRQLYGYVFKHLSMCAVLSVQCNFPMALDWLPMKSRMLLQCICCIYRS